MSIQTLVINIFLMKRILFSLFVLAIGLMSVFADDNVKFVPGKDLTLIGNLMDTPDRYARVDTIKYTGFTDYQRQTLNQASAGLALVFITDSRNIQANIDYKKRAHNYNTNDIACAGLDLYIFRDGKWVYAGSGVPSQKGAPVKLVSNMAPGEKKCLLYLPLFSIVNEVYVGVDPDATISAAPNPFNKKVVFWGSSYTHGTSASRPGMAYPLQLQRATGWDIRALGVSGNSKLQQSYARVLADTEADVFVFDAFSNPKADEIRKNFDSFLKTVREKHPTTPLIFQNTIYRGIRNFDVEMDKSETAKMEAGVEMVRKAMETDPNIYLIFPVADLDGTSSTDKTHPSDLGYAHWAESILQPIIEIIGR